MNRKIIAIVLSILASLFLWLLLLCVLIRRQRSSTRRRLESFRDRLTGRDRANGTQSVASFYSPGARETASIASGQILDIQARQVSGLTDAAASAAVFAEDFRQREGGTGVTASMRDDDMESQLSLAPISPPIFAPRGGKLQLLIEETQVRNMTSYQAINSNNPFLRKDELLQRSPAQTTLDWEVRRDSWSYISSGEPLPTYIETPVSGVADEVPSPRYPFP